MTKWPFLVPRSLTQRILGMLAFLFVLVLILQQARHKPHSIPHSSTSSDANPASGASPSPRRGLPFRSGQVMPPLQHAISPPQGGETQRIAQAVENSLDRIEKDREAADQLFRQAFYTQRLEKLGLTHEQVEKVHSRLTAMRNEAVLVGDATINLLRNRARHDQEMQQLLGDTAYKEYRRLEAEKAPFQQLQSSIIPFAKERNVEIDSLMRPTLVALMAEYGLNTYETWEGPYDPMPRPGVGEQSAIELAKRTLSRAQNLEKFIAEGSKVLPEEIVSVVSDFFEAEFVAAEQAIAHFSLPREQRMAIEQAERDDLLKRLTGK